MALMSQTSRCHGDVTSDLSAGSLPQGVVGSVVCKRGVPDSPIDTAMKTRTKYYLNYFKIYPALVCNMCRKYLF